MEPNSFFVKFQEGVLVQENKKYHRSEHLLLWRKTAYVIFMLVLNLQACGGGESTVETSSLTPTPADLKKDWTDNGTASEMATGKGSQP